MFASIISLLDILALDVLFLKKTAKELLPKQMFHSNILLAPKFQFKLSRMFMKKLMKPFARPMPVNSLQLLAEAYLESS